MRQHIKQGISALMILLFLLFPIEYAYALSITFGPQETLGEASATIAWKTDLESDSVVKYGVSQQELNTEKHGTTSAKEHTVEIGGLSAGKTYYYQVQSTAGTDTASSSVQSFDMPDEQQPGGPTELPVISGIDASVSGSTATVTWKTDIVSDSKVKYGTSMTDLGEEKATSNYETSHSISLTGLQQDTLYYYKVISCNEVGCADSAVQQLAASYSSQAQFLEVVMPEGSNTPGVSCKITTRPHSKVVISVNGKQQRTATVENGTLETTVTLDRQGSANLVHIVSTDLDGNSAFKDLNVWLDSTPPLLTLESLPAITQEAQLQVRGSVNELCDINIYVLRLAGIDAPGKVTNLSAGQTQGGVLLTWDRSTTDGVSYLVFRSGIGVIGQSNANSYTDMAVTSGQTYQYTVAAQDRGCRVGLYSDPATTTAQFGDKNATALNATCQQTPTETLKQAGQFAATVSLSEGYNIVRVEATDISGNRATVENITLLDTKKPQLKTNLHELSPSYSQMITIEGVVSENATVIAFVNNKTNAHGSWPTNIMDMAVKIGDVMTGEEDYKTRTDTNGHFSIDVYLTNDMAINASSMTQGTSYENDVLVVAIDDAGNTVEERFKVVYGVCGQGADWNIQISNVQPTELVPRYIIEGMAQLGFELDLQWQGIDEQPQIQTVSVNQAPLSQWERAHSDFSWIMGSPQVQGSADRLTNYVSLTLKHDPTPTGSNWTMYEKEHNLTMHNVGQCSALNLPGAKIPEIGCVKLPLMATVTYRCRDYIAEAEREWRQSERASRGETFIPATTPIYKACVQKQCVDVQVMIEPRIPPAAISKSFLNSSINALTAVLDLIDTVREPLRTINTATTAACFVSWVVLWVSSIKEFASCYNVDLPTCQSGSQSCESCITAKQSTLKIERVSNLICDRVMCKTAPTFEKYVEEQRKKNEKLAAEKKTSNCADYTVSTLDGADMEDLYNTDDMEAYKNEHSVLPGQTADTQYCEEEYMDKYNSICLMMNEFKESRCIALKDTDPEAYNDLGCGGATGALRAVADFQLCKTDQQSKLVTIYGQLWKLDRDASGHWTVKTAYTEQSLETVDGRTETTDKVIELDDYSDVIYSVCEDYLAGKLKSGETRDNQGNKVAANWPRYQQTRRYETTVEGSLVGCQDGRIRRKCMCGEDVVDSGDGFCYGGKQSATAQDTSKSKTTGTSATTTTTKTAPRNTAATQRYTDIEYDIPETIISTVCGDKKGKDYVVDPTDGLIRSIQCVCLPAALAYLDHYAKILFMIRACFQTILETGDGSAGVCQTVMTTYVCDLAYYAINCLKQQPVNEGVGARVSSGLPFFSFVKGGSQAVMKSVSDRYGSTSMYQAMFAERKLVHSVCMAAFTGDWNIDFAAMVEQGVDTVPVQSTVAFSRASRRFISFNPVNGKVAHAYHIGLMMLAGSEITYRVKLVCSKDNSCQPVDGYSQDGLCDCANTFAGTGEMDVTSQFGTGTLKKGQMLDVDKYIQVAQNSPYANVRYDKVVVEYQYKDNNNRLQLKSEPYHISNEGGLPPVECKFDITAGYYSCGVTTGANGAAYFLPGSPYITPTSVVIAGNSVTAHAQVMLDYSDTTQPLKSRFVCFFFYDDSGTAGNELSKDSGACGNVISTPGMTDASREITISAADFHAGGSGCAAVEVNDISIHGQPSCSETYKATCTNTQSNNPACTYEPGTITDINREGRTEHSFSATSSSQACTITDKSVRCGANSFIVDGWPAPDKTGIILFKATTSTNAGCTAVPRKFKMKAVIYQAADNGERSSTVEVYTGVKQEKTVEFDAACSS